MRSISRTLALLAATVLMAACSVLTGPERPPLTVSLNVWPSSAAGTMLLTDVGGLSVQVPASTSKDVRVPRLGDVPVRAALVSATGDTLSRVEFDHHFSNGSEHWFAGIVAPQRPFGICVGIQVAAAVRGSATDSLFVAYGSIPIGAIC